MKDRCLAVFVLDVLERDRLERLWARGAAGFLAKLALHGGIRDLVGRDLFSEHGTAWTLFSGVSRVVHGQYDYRQTRPGSYGFMPGDTEASPEVQPFWWRLGPQSRLLVVDAPETLPRRGLGGIQVADWLTARAASIRRGRTVEPPTQAARFRGPPCAADGGAEYRRDSTATQDRQVLARFREEIRRKADVCGQLAKELRPELVIVGFQQLHTAAHRFWRYRHGGPDDLVDAIDQIYCETDRAIAAIAAALPDDTDIVVAGLYGMVDLYPTTGLSDTFCRTLGYHVAVDSPPARMRLLDMVPSSWRAEVGWWLPSRLQENLMASRVAATTDWSRTRAYSTSTLYSTTIRVNLRGREPEGCVSPGEDYESLLDEIVADLRSLRDVDTSTPAIARIVLPSRHYGCGPHSMLPDVIAEWTPRDQFRDSVSHPQAILKQPSPQYFRDSYHTYEGSLLGMGPRLANVQEPIDLLDIAPSLLAIMGHEVPSAMSGKPTLGGTVDTQNSHH